jgi:hypothetical protein
VMGMHGWSFRNGRFGTVSGHYPLRREYDLQGGVLIHPLYTVNLSPSGSSFS